VQSADISTAITCTVTATNAAGTANATSGSVTGANVPSNTVAPVVSGSAYVGATLSSTTGTWNANGATISGYTYQWKRAGSNISGATSSTYVVQDADSGQSVTCSVTATNAAGTATQGSNGITIADAVVAFANFQLPTTTGNFQITTSALGGRVPKMAVFSLCNAESAEGTFATPAGEEGFHNFGATDGTNHWSAMSCTESGTNNDNRGYVTNQCLYMTNAAGTLMLAASFVSLDTNGITINITTLNAELQSKRGFVQFFAGADCHAEVGTINGETDGSATKTLGFTPEGLLITDVRMAATGLAGLDCIQSYGFALNDGSATQYNGSRFLSSGTGQARVEAKAAGHGASSLQDCTISFSGADVTGTWSSALESDLLYAAWSFSGKLTAKAGTITSPTSAQVVTATGLGITPSSAMFITGPGAINTTITGGGFGAGWLTGSGGGSMGSLSKSGYCSTTRLNVAGGADFASLDSFGSGSLGLNFTTADATARLIPFIAFGH
jgi:hypothetical protein